MAVKIPLVLYGGQSAQIQAGDSISFTWLSSLPSTLAGHGITDGALIASPTFTGVPAGPTAAVDTNTTQLATTAFVIAQASAVTPLVDGTGTIGSSLRYARADHVHPSDTTKANLASPTFTGVPAGPTATLGTSTTQLATTAFAVTELDERFKTSSTGGTLDWDDASNTTPGVGYTLLTGTATNGPGPGTYYHPFTIHYGSSGNCTQFAIPYNGFTVYFRYRFSSVWTSWERLTTATDLALKANLASPTFTGTPIFPANVVTLANMAQITTNSLMGRITASTGNVEVLTAANVKTILSLTNVENTALSTWAGSANITTLGTISTGTWSGTAITAVKGGTGLTGFTTGNYLNAASSTTLQQRTPDQVRADVSAIKFSSGASPHASPNPGDEWTDPSTGAKYTYYDDGTGQWVEFSATGATTIAGAPAYISDTTPTYDGAYFWIQTGIGTDGDFALWFNH